MHPERHLPEADPIEHAIAWHDGDARAAIRTLLDDCAHLRHLLALATVAMGHGYTRGWRPMENVAHRPSIDRKVHCEDELIQSDR